MKTLLRRFDEFYYAAASAERLAAVRILVGCFAVIFLLASAPNFLAVGRFAPQDFSPVGPLFWLQAPLAGGVVPLAFGACVLAGVAFTVGYGYVVTAPLFALLLLLLTTYRSSWGMKFHTENLLTLHVLLLAMAPAADAWAWRRSGSLASAQPQATQGSLAAGATHGRYGWVLTAMSVVTVLTYVLAGIAKLRNGGWEWLNGDILRAQIAYDNVRKIELGSIHSPLGALSVGQAWLFPVFGWLTLGVELLAPLALLGRRWALGWVALAWGFHAGVLLLMAIGFPYPLSLVAYASLLPAEKIRDFRVVRRLVVGAA